MRCSIMHCQPCQRTRCCTHLRPREHWPCRRFSGRCERSACQHWVHAGTSRPRAGPARVTAKALVRRARPRPHVLSTCSAQQHAPRERSVQADPADHHEGARGDRREGCYAGSRAARRGRGPRACHVRRPAARTTSSVRGGRPRRPPRRRSWRPAEGCYEVTSCWDGSRACTKPYVRHNFHRAREVLETRMPRRRAGSRSRPASQTIVGKCKCFYGFLKVAPK